MGCQRGTAWSAPLCTEGGGGLPAVKASVPGNRLDAGPGDSAIYLLHAIERVSPMRTVSLTTAHQKFSKLVRAVERGRGFPITRHSRPFAKLVPHVAGESAGPEWTAAHRRMMARLSEGALLAGLRIERNALHGR